MFTQAQIEEMIDLLVTLSKDTKVYIGSDSTRFIDKGRWYASYATVCVIHKNGSNGSRIFVVKSTEPDYDLKASRPSMRMMNEAIKSAEAYVQLAPFLDEFPIEIHADISKDPKHGSNCAAQAAAGYILGVTGIEPKLKPNSWSASSAADWAARI